ncbi:MAG: methyltransferase domain-containing protein [Rhodocyclales bacterium]|nr:methyltransferase domain-containing protein [Rhodocyclales bacterium]
MLNFCYLDPEEILASEDFRVVDTFLRETRRHNIGWHYAVDLTWIYSRARHWAPGLRILDAGGGRGPAQFLLAEMGFDVVNVDLMHTVPDHAYVRRYGTHRTVLASHVATPYLKHILGFGGGMKLFKRIRSAARESLLLRESIADAYSRRHDRWRATHGFGPQPVGRIEWLAGNLGAVPELEAGSFDAVISLSSLEHIPADQIPPAIAEIHRIVRPHGHWALTTSGTERDGTWYHGPSQGYCFSSSELGRLFNARLDGIALPAEILRKYQRSSYLRKNLAPHYRLSGKNGMPWGRWNPVYIPVAVFDRDT